MEVVEKLRAFSIPLPVLKDILLNNKTFHFQFELLFDLSSENKI